MHPLCRQVWLVVPAAVAAMLSISLFAGAVRAMPWIVDPQVPLAIVWPFARELGRVGFEVAVMVGLPVGVAIAAASFVDRGQARALCALGQSPEQLARRALPPVLVTVGLGLLVSLAPRPDPGRLAAELVDTGRGTCLRAKTPRAVEVPIVGVTWLCFPGAAPRVSGAAPGLGSRAHFTAASLLPSADLSELDLQDMRLRVPGRGSWPSISLTVQQAKVRGVVPWATGQRDASRLRALALGLSEIILALYLASVILAGGEGRRVIGTLAGGLGGGALVIAAQALDRQAWGAGWYFMLPPGSVVLCRLVGQVLLPGHSPRAPVARTASR